MSEFLPQAVRDELKAATSKAKRRLARRSVRAGGQDFTVLRHWEGGFALDADEAPGLRGLVDLYDGGRHISQALIVASSESDGERVFEVKRATPASRTAPVADFVRDRPEPAGLLPRA